ncbi:MAG TPA: hypothetical protein PK079_00125 [Leptospiraceae bacterium]|nr:hypothetical protein [Leptospiraceae bacterium]HMW05156.1 hypothetical protein [Leptospiraceae bacterium]HMX32583.1 hypothetical protein [Leptospiraceae bacterium]HMY32495.1 hypothetical protein [Leptospiraceae bacterium]HMZ66956.1 hypothetical protein [Leptospiraceae bacterium]
MIKWKLMMTTLPYMVVVIAINYLLSNLLQFEGIIDFADVGLVLTGGIFLIGFMLAGTMSDYKESEKLPSEIACTLEALEETIDAVCASKDLNGKNMKAILFEITSDIYNWFYKKISYEQMFSSLSRLDSVISQMEKVGASSYATRMLGELNSLRKIITRIGVIARTSFLSTGYALLEVLITAIIILLLISKFKSVLAEYILIGFVSLIYIYMYRLIQDIDDPFEYSETGKPGASEVPLFPIEEYKERAKARL